MYGAKSERGPRKGECDPTPPEHDVVRREQHDKCGEETDFHGPPEGDDKRILRYASEVDPRVRENSGSGSRMSQARPPIAFGDGIGDERGTRETRRPRLF